MISLVGFDSCYIIIVVAQLLETHHRFSVQEYELMGEIFDDNARVELIEGEIVDMVPIGPRHQKYVDRLTCFFVTRWQNDVVVRVQGPIQLNDYSEVQPDIALLRKRPDEYENGHPGPSDTLLVVEISDTTLARDIEKAKLYAQNGVSQCWIIDVNKRELIIMGSPGPDGYTVQHTVSANERIANPLEPDKYPEEYLESSVLFGP